MPDPKIRNRLKEKMLDRWENEGGSIPTDPATADAGRPSSEAKVRRWKQSSSSDNSTVDAPASPTKRRKPSRK